MANKLVWTGLRDGILRTLREQGMSWECVAAAMGISRWTAIGRAKALGLHAPLPRPPRPPVPERGEAPLPAGHPIAWAVLTAGTLLAGTAYPFPPPAPADSMPAEPAGTEEALPTPALAA